jgi:Flp pilus assembly protein TadD
LQTSLLLFYGPDGYADPYNDRGVAKQSIGQRKEAITNYTKAIELQPELNNAYFNRVWQISF